MPSLPRPVGSLSALLLSGVLAAGCATAVPGSGTVSSPADAPTSEAGNLLSASNTTGLLVMAHGGGDDWDQAVERAVTPLRNERPTALALGMADPVTMTAALDSLRGRGVERVAVVRLFVSGSSFLAQTRYFLGLGPAPTHFISHHGAKRRNAGPHCPRARSGDPCGRPGRSRRDGPNPRGSLSGTEP